VPHSVAKDRRFLLSPFFAYLREAAHAGRRCTQLLLVLGLMSAGWGLGSPARAQQKIGYVDTEYVLNQMPEYSTVKQKLDKLEQQWRSEIQEKQKEARELEREFEARELLYTEEERTRKREAIEQARAEVEQLRQKYFGPDGELYSRQKSLMRPLQERILKASERVATADGYDYVVDKKGETLFLYAREEHDLSDRVLRELGITTDEGGDEQR
jgi:outer membrane protein